MAAASYGIKTGCVVNDGGTYKVISGKWFSLALSVRSRTTNLLTVLIVRVRVQSGAECLVIAYSIMVQIARARVSPKYCRLQ